MAEGVGRKRRHNQPSEQDEDERDRRQRRQDDQEESVEAKPERLYASCSLRADPVKTGTNAALSAASANSERTTFGT